MNSLLVEFKKMNQDLPRDVVILVASFNCLSISDMHTMTKVCREWREFLDSSNAFHVWNEIKCWTKVEQTLPLQNDEIHHGFQYDMIPSLVFFKYFSQQLAVSNGGLGTVDSTREEMIQKFSKGVSLHCVAMMSNDGVHYRIRGCDTNAAVDFQEERYPWRDEEVSQTVLPKSPFHSLQDYMKINKHINDLKRERNISHERYRKVSRLFCSCTYFAKLNFAMSIISFIICISIGMIYHDLSSHYEQNVSTFLPQNAFLWYRISSYSIHQMFIGFYAFLVVPKVVTLGFIPYKLGFDQRVPRNTLSIYRTMFITNILSVASISLILLILWTYLRELIMKILSVLQTGKANADQSYGWFTLILPVYAPFSLFVLYSVFKGNFFGRSRSGYPTQDRESLKVFHNLFHWLVISYFLSLTIYVAWLDDIPVLPYLRYIPQHRILIYLFVIPSMIKVAIVFQYIYTRFAKHQRVANRFAGRTLIMMWSTWFEIGLILPSIRAHTTIGILFPLHFLLFVAVFIYFSYTIEINSITM